MKVQGTLYLGLLVALVLVTNSSSASFEDTQHTAIVNGFDDGTHTFRVASWAMARPRCIVTSQWMSLA
jgi:hypothetical protein